ncbi:baculoviral IAP repeat-containing protein 5.2-A-like [Gigantopelta aegis]|uniref:baculoviral IAP repeat-containing protein 5.2-A-like n=1 Tax=Gigantopelta aegis TaxID=1735272 RepID=UPI001B88AFA3|nr:baculoviral IAP repeat-containing protein 5.2-A-like [Gigantopelta aegis]
MDDKTVEEYMMHLEECRLHSFKNWPYSEEYNCTPQKLAEAGWYHCPTNQEPDAVRCFVCLKELDGWEPNDDPWEEHKKHSPQCPLLKLNSKVEDLTVESYLRLESKRQKIRVQKILDARIEEYRNAAKEIREEMVKITSK